MSGYRKLCWTQHGVQNCIDVTAGWANLGALTQLLLENGAEEIRITVFRDQS